ncbi:MAG TPA: STAS domain-containing protein [Acidimicrobiia bacterium]|nr:STAS domain-containing protein [Acidimicrobiia bacterium]
MTVRVALEGSFDAKTTLAVLLPARGSEDDIVVDCADLDYIDVAGIRTLAGFSRGLETHGHHLRFTHLSPFHQRMFELVDVSWSPDA